MRITIWIFSFCLLWNISYSQQKEIEFKIVEKNGEMIDFLRLSINDTILILPDINGKYIYNESLGNCHITSETYGYKVIDTFLTVDKYRQIIHLTADIINNALLNEFNIGFKKIYFSERHSIVIGLKEDDTFLIKSFFHTALAACHQFEKGKYRIVDNELVLNVTQYESPCMKINRKFIHEYRYTLLDEKIVDFGKYAGFIEKTYLGQK